MFISQTLATHVYCSKMETVFLINTCTSLFLTFRTKPIFESRRSPSNTSSLIQRRFLCTLSVHGVLSQPWTSLHRRCSSYKNIFYIISYSNQQNSQRRDMIICYGVCTVMLLLNIIYTVWNELLYNLHLEYFMIRVPWLPNIKTIRNIILRK